MRFLIIGHPKCGSKYVSQERLAKLFDQLSFYKKIEVKWTDKLDNTKENGVWCWVYDRDKQRGKVGLVVYFGGDTYYPYETTSTSICATSSVFIHADHLPKELSDKFSELEEDIKKLKESI